MKFRYFKEGARVGDGGTVRRVAAEEAGPYLLKLFAVAFEDEDGKTGTQKVGKNNILQEVGPGETAELARARGEEVGHVFKFDEVSFKDWEAPVEWPKDDQGRLVDPVHGPLDAETGEPVAA